MSKQKCSDFKDAVFADDGKPNIAVTTTDAKNPDEVQAVIDAGRAAATAVSWLPKKPSPSLTLGGALVSPSKVISDLDKTAKQYSQARYIWIRVQVNECKNGKISVGKPQWILLNVGDLQGFADIKDLTDKELEKAINDAMEKVAQ